MTKQLTTIILMSLFSFLFGCKNNKENNTNNYELEEITSRLDIEEGWSDIFLKIIEDKKTDNSHIYIVKGLYKTKIVGLQVEVSSKIKAGFKNDEIDAENGFLPNSVKLKSIGIESDELIKALAELYEQPSDKNFTSQIITATSFSLNEKPVNLDKSDYYKLKLFFEEEDENLYSEIYLNINTDKGEIEIHEKDQEYREPIIKVLTNK
jgi:hypothetical protein